MPSRHSIAETPLAAALPHEALNNGAENGVKALPHINTATTVEQPPPSAGVYKPPVKDTTQVKSPQLPKGENVAVATATDVS